MSGTGKSSRFSSVEYDEDGVPILTDEEWEQAYRTGIVGGCAAPLLVKVAVVVAVERRVLEAYQSEYPNDWEQEMNEALRDYFDVPRFALDHGEEPLPDCTDPPLVGPLRKQDSGMSSGILNGKEKTGQLHTDDELVSVTVRLEQGVLETCQYSYPDEWGSEIGEIVKDVWDNWEYIDYEEFVEKGGSSNATADAA